MCTSRLPLGSETGGKDWGLQGARLGFAGSKTGSCQIRAPARTFWGGRPYICERAA